MKQPRKSDSIPAIRDYGLPKWSGDPARPVRAPKPSSPVKRKAKRK